MAHAIKSRPADIIRLGYELQARGYDIREHPRFGGVTLKWHRPGTKHHPDRAEAIDINYRIEVPTSRAEDDRLDRLGYELVARNFGFIFNRGANDHVTHGHAETLTPSPGQYPGRFKPKRKVKGAGLKVDGTLGPKTWRAVQVALGTPATGKVSESGSTVIKALQRRLNKRGHLAG